MRKMIALITALAMLTGFSGCGNDKDSSSSPAAESSASSGTEKNNEAFEKMAGSFRCTSVIVNFNGMDDGYKDSDIEKKYKDSIIEVTEDGILKMDGKEFPLKAKKSDMFDNLVIVENSGYDGKSHNSDRKFADKDFEGPIYFNYASKGTDPWATGGLENDFIDLYYSPAGTEDWYFSMEFQRCDENGDLPGVTAAATETASETETTTMSGLGRPDYDPLDSLQLGKWLGVSEDPAVPCNDVLFFNDYSSGVLVDVSIGKFSDFDFTESDGKLELEFASGKKQKGEILEDGSVRLYYEGEGEDHTLLFHFESSGQAGNMQFFEDDVIEKMAKLYFAKHIGKPNYITTVTDQNGNVKVDIVGGDNQQETYTFDRFSGLAKDSSSKTIDMATEYMNTKYLPASIWQPEITEKSEMSRKDSFCGVVYLGYTDADKTLEKDRSYFDNHFDLTGYGKVFDWLYELPETNLVSVDGAHELYLVIPRDEDAHVAVFRWDAVNNQEQGLIYHSDNGTPFLLRCNVSEIAPDVRIQITDNSGEHEKFSPSISGKDGTLSLDSDKVIDLSHYDLLGITPED